MDNNIVMVKSASDNTLVVNIPDIPLIKVWRKRNTKLPIDRQALVQAYYDPAVEALFKKGLLITDDKEFLKAVGLMDEEGVTEVVELTEQLMIRLIKNMPLAEFKKEVVKLSVPQIDELAQYAITHYTDLVMDRVDFLTQISRRDIMKSIANHRAAQEG